MYDVTYIHTYYRKATSIRTICTQQPIVSWQHRALQCFPTHQQLILEALGRIELAAVGTFELYTHTRVRIYHRMCERTSTQVRFGRYYYLGIEVS